MCTSRNVTGRGGSGMSFAQPKPSAIRAGDGYPPRPLPSRFFASSTEYRRRPAACALAAAFLLLLGAGTAQAQTVDTTPPTLDRGEIDGGTMTLYFSEALGSELGGRHLLCGCAGALSFG